MPDLDLSAPWSVLKRTSDGTDLVKRTVIWFDVICEYLNFKLIAASNDSMAENANGSERFGNYRAVKVLQEACADLYHPNLDNPSRHLRDLTSFHVHWIIFKYVWSPFLWRSMAQPSFKVLCLWHNSKNLESCVELWGLTPQRTREISSHVEELTQGSTGNDLAVVIYIYNYIYIHISSALAPAVMPYR